MRKYLVVSVEDGNDFYLVDDLTELINEMYECELFDNEFEVVKGWFFDNFKVFVSGSDIIELTNYLKSGSDMIELTRDID